MPNVTTETKTPYGIIFRNGDREWFPGSVEEFRTAKVWEENQKKQPNTSQTIKSDMENTLTDGKRIEVKVWPFQPPYKGIVHDNQNCAAGWVRVFLDARPGMAESSRMTCVKINNVKVIA